MKKKKKSKKLGRPKLEKNLKIDVPEELATPDGVIEHKPIVKDKEEPKKPTQPRYTCWGIVRDNETKLYASVIIHTDSLDDMNETCMWCSYIRAFASFEDACFRNNTGAGKGRII